jgi:hypothetical protein
MYQTNKHGQLLTHVKVVKAVLIQNKEVILQKGQAGSRVTAMPVEQWNRLHKQYNMHPSLLSAQEGYFVKIEAIPAPSPGDILSYETTDGAELACVREAEAKAQADAKAADKKEKKTPAGNTAGNTPE